MNMFTKVSDKGQVVVPKVLRDLKGWTAGTALEVVDVGDGIMLRPRRDKSLTPAAAVAEFRRIYRYRGPPVSLEQMKEDARETAARRRDAD